MISLKVLFYAIQALSQGHVDLDIRRPIFGGESGQLYAKCQIDNKPYNCFLDTGARQSSVPKDDFFSRYTVSGHGTRTGAHGDILRTEHIVINNWGLGGQLSQNLEVDRIDFKTPITDPLIGNDFFWPTTMTFDFNKGQLFFKDLTPQNTEIHSLDEFHGKWIGMPVLFGDKVVSSLWDTGASLTVVSRSFAETNPEKFTFIREVEVRDAAGSTSLAKVYKTDFQVGIHKKKNLTVVAISFEKIHADVSPDVHAIVGFNYYYDYNWLIDYKNQKWALWPR